MGIASVALFASLGTAAQAVQTCDRQSYPQSSPTARFEDQDDGTVTDHQSMLMWMRCSTGQAWSNGHCAGEASALTFDAALSTVAEVNRSGGHFFNDWRMPQVNELATIAERQCADPRINLDLFPDTPAEFYWTATSRRSKQLEHAAFALSFGPDGVRYIDKEETSHVRLVRTAR